MTAALEGGEWSAARPGRTLPPGKARYPFYRRLGGPQGRSGREENLVPTGIRSRTVQPVVSRYTDWATRPTYIRRSTILILWKTPGCIFKSFTSHLTDITIDTVDSILKYRDRRNLLSGIWEGEISNSHNTSTHTNGLCVYFRDMSIL